MKSRHDVVTPQVSTISVAIEGMHCASCVGRVERALNAVPGVTEAAVNLATEQARVTGTMDSEQIIAAVKTAGYAARKSESAENAEAASEQKDRERQALKRDLLLATLLAMAVCVVGRGHAFS